MKCPGGRLEEIEELKARGLETLNDLLEERNILRRRAIRDVQKRQRERSFGSIVAQAARARGR